MEITTETRLIALFGNPVGHSLSPVFQNAALRALGYDALYLAFDLAPENLGEALASLRLLNAVGANLTIPHKEDVLPILDQVSPMALRVGSVNTIINQDGVLRGETTDGEGFIRSLREETGMILTGRVFMILGAGGAGRAIACALAEADADVILCNRTQERAESLAWDLSEIYPERTFTVLPFSRRGDRLASGSIDCLVNASSVGLRAEEEIDLFEESELPGNLVVCDLIYHRVTKLLAASRRKGLKAINGLGMLIHQGAISLEMWTGRPAPVAEMFAAARAALEITPGNGEREGAPAQPQPGEGAVP